MPWPTTQWGLLDVLRVGDADQRSSALGEIIAIYGPPLFAFAHHHTTLSREDCEDVVEDFFLKCIKKPVFEQADPARGRFRNFLAKSFKNFMLNWVRDHGPRGRLVSWDELLEKHGQVFEPRADESPEDTYERVLRVSLFNYTLAEFEKACRAAGQDKKYDIFVRREIAPLPDGPTRPSYAALAIEFGLPSEDAVGRIVRAARDEFESRLLEKISNDTESPTEATVELKLVFASGVQNSSGSFESP